LLSTSEKRFIRYWQEQRTGGRWSYYALYIAIGTFIGTIILSTFLFLFFQVIFGTLSFWIALSVAFLISSVATILTWSSNEKKFKRIVRREMEKGIENEIL
jgi:VIT1/CCC1 family predicted Fe2+/Mn2+ transporter